MGRRSQDVGRKVPRGSFERDRRTILKQVPKLRKIKPAKPKKFTAESAEIAKTNHVSIPWTPARRGSAAGEQRLGQSLLVAE